MLIFIGIGLIGKLKYKEQSNYPSDQLSTSHSSRGKGFTNIPKTYDLAKTQISPLETGPIFVSSPFGSFNDVLSVFFPVSLSQKFCLEFNGTDSDLQCGRYSIIEKWREVHTYCASIM